MFTAYRSRLLVVGVTPILLLGVAAFEAKGQKKANEATNKDRIIGTWFSPKEPSVEIKFGKDGKLKVIPDGQKKGIEGTYAVEGDKVTMNVQGESKILKIKRLTDTDLHLEMKTRRIRVDAKSGKRVEEDGVVQIQELKKEVSGSDRAKAKAALAAAKNSPETLLKVYANAYRNYLDTFDKGPSKAEDLGPYMENIPRFMNPLKSGDVVFIYNVKPTDMKSGPAKTVLAYTKETPTKGGTVLMGDGKVVKMTAAEFKKASLAKAKGK